MVAMCRIHTYRKEIRDIYAIGACHLGVNSNSISFLVDFTTARSTGAAAIIALQESVQCAIEELNCIESDLEVRTFSYELVSWFAEEDISNRENGFTTIM